MEDPEESADHVAGLIRDVLDQKLFYCCRNPSEPACPSCGRQERVGNGRTHAGPEGAGAPDAGEHSAAEKRAESSGTPSRPVKMEGCIEDIAVMENLPDGFTTYPLCDNEDDDCPEWIRDISSDDMEWAVRHPDGRCMRVSRTDIIAIPDAKGVKTTIDYNKANCIKERTKTIKSKEGHLDEYFVECTDINLIPGTDTSMMYYVEVRERDLKTKVQNASNVYAVDGPDGLFMDRMIPLMDVPFVRHAQYTVTPFPVKYLREFVLTRTR